MLLFAFWQDFSVRVGAAWAFTPPSTREFKSVDMSSTRPVRRAGTLTQHLRQSSTGPCKTYRIIANSARILGKMFRELRWMSLYSAAQFPPIAQRCLGGFTLGMRTCQDTNHLFQCCSRNSSDTVPSMIGSFVEKSSKSSW